MGKHRKNTPYGSGCVGGDGSRVQLKGLCLSSDHTKNLSLLSGGLRASSSFDIIERHLTVGGRDLCFFFIDGFAKDSEMQRVMTHLLQTGKIGTADEVMRGLPYVEVEVSSDVYQIVHAVLSGQSCIIGEGFGD